MELLRTEGFLLRHWEDADLPARAVLAAAQRAGIGQVLALTDPDNVRSQAVAARLDMHDEGLTSRWFGLTTRQYRKTLGGEPRPVR